MNKGLVRSALVALGGVLLSATSGCQALDEDVLIEFVADFARSALAAYLL